jgi:predicted DNA-binding protein with PD1-like motif
MIQHLPSDLGALGVLSGVSLLLFSACSPLRAAEYVPPGPIAARPAPGLRAHLLSEQNGRKTYVLAFGKGDEVMSGLVAFAEQHHLRGAHFTAIGAFQSADVAWFDDGRRAFRKNPVHSQVEVASLIGNIATENDKPLVHVHCTLARPDGELVGGHLLEARVFPTLEVFLTEEPAEVRKAHDPETGLELIQ